MKPLEQVQTTENEISKRFDKLAHRLPWITVEPSIHEPIYKCEPEHRSQLVELYNRVLRKVILKG